MEAEFNHLNHATWECVYHVVFTPKYRKKLLFGKIKRHLGQVFHDLARRKECRIEEGHLMPDHVAAVRFRPRAPRDFPYCQRHFLHSPQPDLTHPLWKYATHLH